MPALRWQANSSHCGSACPACPPCLPQLPQHPPASRRPCRLPCPQPPAARFQAPPTCAGPGRAGRRGARLAVLHGPGPGGLAAALWRSWRPGVCTPLKNEKKSLQLGNTAAPQPSRETKAIAAGPHLTRMLRCLGHSEGGSAPTAVLFSRDSFSRADISELAGSHMSSFHHCTWLWPSCGTQGAGGARAPDVGHRQAGQWRWREAGRRQGGQAVWLPGGPSRLPTNRGGLAGGAGGCPATPGGGGARRPPAHLCILLGKVAVGLVLLKLIHCELDGGAEGPHHVRVCQVGACAGGAPVGSRVGSEAGARAGGAARRGPASLCGASAAAFLSMHARPGGQRTVGTNHDVSLLRCGHASHQAGRLSLRGGSQQGVAGISPSACRAAACHGGICAACRAQQQAGQRHAWMPHAPRTSQHSARTRAPEGAV